MTLARRIQGMKYPTPNIDHRKCQDDPRCHVRYCNGSFLSRAHTNTFICTERERKKRENGHFQHCMETVFIGNRGGEHTQLIRSTGINYT